MKNTFLKFSHLVFATVLLIIFCAGGPLLAQQEQKISLPAVEMKDQPYGSHEKQKFDIYLPAGRSVKSTPVLFMIHGGGWAAGNKSGFGESVKWFQTAFPQMAYVAVGYRLADSKAGTDQFPTQEEDVRACIEYVLKNRAEYGISERFATYGISAGAHLAMLYAYKYGSISYKPAAVVSIVGPTNLSKIGEQVMMINHPKKEDYFKVFIDAIGGTVEEKSELYRTSSPINYVTSASSPTLMLYGADDPIVPWQQPEELDVKLTAYGVKHTYMLYTGQGHSMKGVSSEMNKEIITFLNTYLK